MEVSTAKVSFPSTQKKQSSCNSFQSLLWEEFLGGGGGGRECGEAMVSCDNDVKNEAGVDLSLVSSVNCEVEEVTCPPAGESGANTEVVECKGGPEKEEGIIDLKVKFNLKEPILRLRKLSRDIVARKTVIVTKDNRILFPEEEDEYDEVDAYLLSDGSTSEEENAYYCRETRTKIVPPHSNMYPSAFHMPQHLYTFDGAMKFGVAGFLSSAYYQDRGTSFFLHMNRYQPEVQPTAYPPIISNYPPTAALTQPELSASKLKAQSTANQRSSHKKPTKLGRGKRRRRHKNLKERDNGNGGKLWSCDFCDKTFLYKWNMNTHLLLHTGEKPFPCILCQSRFRVKYQLVRHIVNHHSVPTDEKLDTLHQNKSFNPPLPSTQCSCVFCGVVFRKGREFLERHLMTEHPDKICNPGSSRRRGRPGRPRPSRNQASAADSS